MYIPEGFYIFVSVNFKSLRIMIKTSIKLVALAGFLVSVVACKEANSAPAEGLQEETTLEQKDEVAQINPEHLQKASMTIDGMHCEFGCAKTIEKKLASLDGVQSAKVDFEKKSAEIEYDATMQTPQVLAQVIEGMADGNTYKVSGVSASSDRSEVYFDQEKKRPSKKDKKDQKAKEQTTTTQTQEPKACCSEKSAEKKAGCCSEKKSCSQSGASTM